MQMSYAMEEESQAMHVAGGPGGNLLSDDDRHLSNVTAADQTTEVTPSKSNIKIATPTQNQNHTDTESHTDLGVACCLARGNDTDKKVSDTSSSNSKYIKDTTSSIHPTDEKDAQIPTQPAEGLPDGWVMRRIPRSSGGRKDPYWYSPLQRYKFRSKNDAQRFLKCLDKTSGDESKAIQLFKNDCVGDKKSPPGIESMKKDTSDITSIRVYGKGYKVYAAWWPENEIERSTPPLWYSGTIKGYKTLDNKARLYNVTFDDGDKIGNLKEEHIMTKEEYDMKMKKEIKPLFDKGDEVYAAFWPDDKRSASTPSWYPGKIKSYREVKGDGRGEYGPTRFYDVV